MYRITKRINGISMFELRSGEVLFLSNARLYNRGILLGPKCIWPDNVCSFVADTAENVIFSTWDRKIYLYKEGSVQQIIEGYSLSEKKLNNETIVISKRVSEDVSKRFLFDLGQNSILTEVKDFPILSDSKFSIFLESPTTLVLFDLPLYERRWSVDISSVLLIDAENLVEIKQVFSINTNILSVLYTLNGSSRLLSIEVSTGQMLWKSSNEILSDIFSLKNVYERNSLFNLYSSYVESDRRCAYMELDGEKGTIIREGHVASLLTEKLVVQSWLYQKNKIYFTARRETFVTNYLGVLDYDTLDLLWYDEVPGRNGALIDIQVSQDKLYVLDASGTLHIFEETDETDIKPMPEKVELKANLPSLSKFKADVYDVDVSYIPFFVDYPFSICTIEVTGSYSHTILTLLAAIETLIEEQIDIVQYDYQQADNEVKILYLIFGVELVIDTTLNDFIIPTSILEDVNGVLTAQQFAKRIKEFEPMPPDDNIILTYVDQDGYNRYGLAGYGTWNEYNRDSGEKEWIGAW